MKPKSLAVITLLVFCCSAAFAQGSAVLGFTSAGNQYQYCNSEYIVWGGSHNFYMEGIDDLEGCDVGTYATIEGVKVSIAGYDDSPVYTGPAYAYADNIYDAFSGSYTGFQWFVITQTKPSNKTDFAQYHYGWVGYVGFEGYEYLLNYGFLTTLPSELPGLGYPNAELVGDVKQASRNQTIPGAVKIPK